MSFDTCVPKGRRRAGKNWQEGRIRGRNCNDSDRHAAQCTGLDPGTLYPGTRIAKPLKSLAASTDSFLRRNLSENF
eukprot:529252-Rhodomonas_salina.1